ncbi:MAG: hypothetical protein ABSA26_03820 [Thermoguttaceae bacterium]|jgi:hypothetical protein
MKTYLYKLKIFVFVLPAVLAAALCLAQGFYGGYGGYSPYINNQATTVGQSYAYGMSDVIRSKGSANLMNSQAAINATEAQKNEIQNHEQYASTYFKMQKENRAAVAEERGPRPTAEDLVRYAQMGKPKPLGPDQLDVVTGKIYWPAALRTDQFASNRVVLDEVFAKRAKYGDISMDDLMKIQDETNKMINLLNKQIRDIPPMIYTSTKQFLSSLAYQVNLVAS